MLLLGGKTEWKDWVRKWTLQKIKLTMDDVKYKNYWELNERPIFWIEKNAELHKYHHSNWQNLVTSCFAAFRIIDLKYEFGTFSSVILLCISKIIVPIAYFKNVTNF